MKEQMVTVAVFGAPYEAGMAKSELESHGIPVYVADEFTIGANNLYSNALGGIKVNVPASCVVAARQILSAAAFCESGGDPALEGPINVPQKMDKSFAWFYLGMIIIALLSLVFVYMQSF